jgi:hypothetical protein
MAALQKSARQPSVMELMSDWSKRQSCGELMTQKILRPSAKIKNLQWLIEIHRTLMNTLKRKNQRTDPCGTPEVTRNGKETVPETRTPDCLFVK